jgi:hypothetical protein
MTKSQNNTALPVTDTPPRADYCTPKLEEHRAWKVTTAIQSVPVGPSGKYWFDGKFWSDNDPWDSEN